VLEVFTLLKLTTDGHEASCGLSATAELLLSKELQHKNIQNNWMKRSIDYELGAFNLMRGIQRLVITVTMQLLKV